MGVDFTCLRELALHSITVLVCHEFNIRFAMRIDFCRHFQRIRYFPALVRYLPHTTAWQQLMTCICKGELKMAFIRQGKL